MATKRSRSPKKRSSRKSGGLFENKVAWISGAIILLILFQIFVMRDEGLYSLLQLNQEIRDMESESYETVNRLHCFCTTKGR